jgi:hypothetical protein
MKHVSLEGTKISGVIVKKYNRQDESAPRVCAPLVYSMQGYIPRNLD